MRGQILGLALAVLCVAQPVTTQQEEGAPYSSYKVLVQELVDRRARGAEEPHGQQERVMHYLDQFVLTRLNASPPASIEEISAGLSRFVRSEQPFGEDYSLQSFPETNPIVFALTANLGLSGPAAVRLYERKAGRFQLTASIDQFLDPDFDDAYLKALLFPPSGGELFLITVSGRTDSYSTGTFTLWAVAQGEARKAWVAEALPFSSYELSGFQLRLEFCEQQDEEKPEVCRQRARERYTLQNGEFRRAEHTVLPGEPVKK